MTLTTEQIEKLAEFDTYGNKGQFRCEEFACWTNGYFLIALKTDYDARPGQPHYGQVPGMITPYQKWKAMGQTDTARLLEWCAVADCKECKNSRKMDCGECGGSGDHRCECQCGELEHTVDCGECDGTGKVKCPCVAKPFEGRIFNRTYNRHLIRQALELSGATGPLILSIQNAADVLDIRWPDGVICGMPLRVHEDNAEEFRL